MMRSGPHTVEELYEPLPLETRDVESGCGIYKKTGLSHITHFFVKTQVRDA